jgi:hypothetical protein
VYIALIWIRSFMKSAIKNSIIAGPEGSGRKNFKIWTRYNKKAGPEGLGKKNFIIWTQ